MENGADGERVPLREAESGTVGGEWSGSVQAGGIAAGEWLTIDGPLGVNPDDAVKLAKKYFCWGFFLLPWLWFVNFFYFWPVVRNPQLDPPTRFYVLGSGICCLALTTLVLGWVITFTVGGERIFGSTWEHLLVYDIADKYALALSQ